MKIIDFGFACISKEKLKVFCGTPSYMSPEIVAKTEYSGAAADVWACGVLLFVMLTGQVPFKATSEKELFRKILKGLYSFGKTENKAHQNCVASYSVQPGQTISSCASILNTEDINSNQYMASRPVN